MRQGSFTTALLLSTRSTWDRQRGEQAKGGLARSPAASYRTGSLGPYSESNLETSTRLW